MEGNKVKVTSTMLPELVEWIDERVASRRFGSRSHALEVAIIELRKSEEIRERASIPAKDSACAI